MKKVADMIPDHLTVYEFLTELSNEQLDEIIELVNEHKALRKEVADSEGE